MTVFQARVRLGSNVILPNIAVELEEASGPSFFSWKGRFTLAAGSQLTPKQTYKLELSDGRRGDFYLARLSAGGAGGGLTQFSARRATPSAPAKRPWWGPSLRRGEDLLPGLEFSSRIVNAGTPISGVRHGAVELYNTHLPSPFGVGSIS